MPGCCGSDGAAAVSRRDRRSSVSDFLLRTSALMAGVELVEVAMPRGIRPPWSRSCGGRAAGGVTGVVRAAEEWCRGSGRYACVRMRVKAACRKPALNRFGRPVSDNDANEGTSRQASAGL